MKNIWKKNNIKFIIRKIKTSYLNKNINIRVKYNNNIYLKRKY